MNAYKTFSDALSFRPAPVAANDNKPKKQPEPKYRGTLPALRWLHDNHPEFAEAIARAVASLSPAQDDADAIDSVQTIQPSVGELLNAATESKTEEGERNWHEQTYENHPEKNGGPVIHLGSLRFRRGEMIEFGKTKKGRKLQPRDRLTSRDDKVASPPRNVKAYIFGLRATTPSPLHAEPLPRNMSGLPALAPMYDPQPGVEANRALLRSFGVDGSVAFDDLPFRATKCPPAIAKGAEFLSGVVGLSGTSSSGAMDPFETPEKPASEAWRIVEDVASGATLQSMGLRMGYNGTYAVEVGKTALLAAAKALIAANDNHRRKIAV